ncbi:uncharacterized protein [Parasteatoda tepidariorum]|uniref:uncharacterized protein isoform X1 n=1 Tax=Parasteatoda tepidariorum TaxID=114398 RepID=UPI001C718B96|nr:uncharacterized protein LOC107437698 isoform X1 [Parasteatoda tepidariorum]
MIMFALFTFLRYFTMLSVIVMLYNLAINFLSKILKILIPEHILNATKLDQNISLEDIAVQLMEVRKISQKVSNEKDILKSIFLVNDDFLQQTHKCFVDIQDQIRSRFEAIGNENKARYDQVQEMALNLREEISKLKVQVEQTDEILKSQKFGQLEEEPSKSCKDCAEAFAQTEESYEIVPNEVSDCSLSEEELMSLKQGVSIAMIESEKLCKDAILGIFNNFEKEYESIKALIETSWDGINEEVANCGSVLDKVHNIEQTVFGVLIFLQQQSVDGQTIKETLKFFDHKLKISIQKIEARANKNNLCLQVAFDSLQNAHAVLNVSTLAFKDISMDVAQKLDCLSKMVSQFGYTAKLLNDAEHLTFLMEKSICELVLKAANLSTKINGDYCFKISKLSEELLAPGENLYVFCKTLEDLHTLTDGLKSQSHHNSLDTETANLEFKQQPIGNLTPDDKTGEVDTVEKSFKIALYNISQDYQM